MDPTSKEVQEETKLEVETALDDEVVLSVLFDRNAVSAQLPPHVETDVVGRNSSPDTYTHNLITII